VAERCAPRIDQEIDTEGGEDASDEQLAARGAGGTDPHRRFDHAWPAIMLPVDN